MFHSSRSSTRRERELKGDWKRQIFIETVRQEAQPQLKQTEITAVGALQDRYPVILLGDAAQIHDPQMSIVARECTTTVGHIAPPIVGQDVPLGDETSRDASLPPTPMIRRHAAPASPPFGSGLLYP